MKPITFYEPGKLVDGDLELVLTEKYPGDPAISYSPAYRFKMVHPGQAEQLGLVELRIGSTRNIFYGGHLGYRVEPAHRGHGYAARACRLLKPLARRHGFTELWITCTLDNHASHRTCERMGAKLIEIVDLPEDTDLYREGERQMLRFRLEL